MCECVLICTHVYIFIVILHQTVMQQSKPQALSTGHKVWREYIWTWNCKCVLTRCDPTSTHPFKFIVQYQVADHVPKQTTLFHGPWVLSPSWWVFLDKAQPFLMQIQHTRHAHTQTHTHTTTHSPTNTHTEMRACMHTHTCTHTHTYE